MDSMVARTGGSAVKTISHDFDVIRNADNENQATPCALVLSDAAWAFCSTSRRDGPHHGRLATDSHGNTTFYDAMGRTTGMRSVTRATPPSTTQVARRDHQGTK
jgi:hypothetical protein